MCQLSLDMPSWHLGTRVWVWTRDTREEEAAAQAQEEDEEDEEEDEEEEGMMYDRAEEERIYAIQEEGGGEEEGEPVRLASDRSPSQTVYEALSY